MVLKKKLSKIVQNKRLEDNLNVHEAANKIGISYLTLWNIENSDYTNLSYKTINKLAIWLKCEPKDIRNLL